MTNEPEALDDSLPPAHSYVSDKRPPTRWQENHGNLLIVFVGAVFLFGACILVYRQNRFVPVRFPESDMIEVPVEVDSEPVVDPANMVTVRVIGAGHDLGVIKIAIYDSESAFNRLADAVLSTTASIIDGAAKWDIPASELPRQIAVAAFHDENNDDVLNRNALGIPSERYGFSRDARGLTGPPSFSKAVIGRPAAGETLEISIR